MGFKSVLAISAMLALASAVPTSTATGRVPRSPPTFKDVDDGNYTITTEGRHGNGAGPHNHTITAESVKRAGEIVKAMERDLEARQGYGTASGAALNWYNADFTAGAAGYADPSYYWCFSGSASHFPAFSAWMNFHDAFNMNQQTSMILEESGPVQGAIYNAIVQISEASKIDARLILAVIMQESTGNVYVPCTGYENCGLMQAYPGSVSYNAADMQNSITQMVRDGTQGTTQGPGLEQWMTYWNYNYDVSVNSGGNPYISLRGYNSYAVNLNDLNVAGAGSTSSYVSDVANRLQGWNGLDTHGYRAACGW